MVLGIGPITASALVASIGEAKDFDGGRQVAAWLGLVPRQHSSRAVIYRVSQRADACSWISGVVNRRNNNVAAVALATEMLGSRGRYWPTTGSSMPAMC